MMTLTKTFTVALAAAIAIALSPLPELSAAPSGRGGTQFKSDLVQAAQAKKKGKKKKRAKKRKGTKGAAAGKSCGTFKYRKGGKCLDARDKK